MGSDQCTLVLRRPICAVDKREDELLSINSAPLLYREAAIEAYPPEVAFLEEVKY
jgi:hypothetical protein